MADGARRHGVPETSVDTANVCDITALHDLQQPVAALRPLLERLPDASLGRRQVQRLRDVPLEEIAVMQRLVSECLDTMSGGRPAPVRLWRVPEAEAAGPTSFDAVVRAVLATFAENGLAFTCTDKIVVVPPQQLRRVVSNVVYNAVRATRPPPGRVAVELRRIGDTAVLLVDDSGPGFGAVAMGHGLGFLNSVAVVFTFDGSLQILPNPIGSARIRISSPVVSP